MGGDLELPCPPQDYLVTWGKPVRYAHVAREWASLLSDRLRHGDRQCGDALGRPRVHARDPHTTGGPRRGWRR